jgi:hypothetical protein
MTQSIRVKPGLSGKSGVSGPKPGHSGLPRPAPKIRFRECVGAKVSLIGFVLATRAPVRPLEDIILVPLDSTAFLGLKFKSKNK